MQLLGIFRKLNKSWQYIATRLIANLNTRPLDHATNDARTIKYKYNHKTFSKRIY